MQYVILCGRIGNDAEKKTTQKTSFLTFSLACSFRRGGKTEPVWYEICCFGSNKWDNLQPYLTKGKSVTCFGSLKPPSIYKAKDGTPKISMQLKCDQIHLHASKQDSTESHSNAESLPNVFPVHPPNDPYNAPKPYMKAPSNSPQQDIWD